MLWILRNHNGDGNKRAQIIFLFIFFFCFEQEKALKNVSKKLYTSKIKKKEEAETKTNALDLKKT